MGRYELQDRYLELMRTDLPIRAKQQYWVVTEDHCFMRIILDQLFGDCWYNHLDRRVTAYKQLSEAQLRECIAFAEELLRTDGEGLATWNAQSLNWRGKRK